MDTMRGALERAKMLVGMEVDEESGLPPPEEQSFFDDINRNCTLNTTQASTHARTRGSPQLIDLSVSLASWIRGAGEPCLRADPAVDLATGLLVSAGTGEESR